MRKRREVRRAGQRGGEKGFPQTRREKKRILRRGPPEVRESLRTGALKAAVKSLGGLLARLGLLGQW